MAEQSGVSRADTYAKAVLNRVRASGIEVDVAQLTVGQLAKLSEDANIDVASWFPRWQEI